MAASISDIRLLLRVKSLPKSADSRRVFITGGTGYLGNSLILGLIERGHRVRALIRPLSRGKLPAGCEVVSGNAVDANTYRHLVRPCDTFIHLVGVPTESRSNANAIRAVDMVSTREAISVATDLGIPQFVYVSVAQPAPIRRAYVGVRADCEQMIRENGLQGTILRPWYVLGPGRRWPVVLLPVYKIFELLPFTRAAAQRLGLVTLQQMVLALVEAVECPSQSLRVMTVPEIRSARLQPAPESVRKTA